MSKRIFLYILFIMLNLNGFAQNVQWAKKLGINQSYDSRNLAFDKVGNIYTTGEFKSTVDFDPNAGAYNVTPKGSSNLYILKLDTLGIFSKVKTIGGSSISRFAGKFVGLDISENIYSVGYFNNTAYFDTITLHQVSNSSSNFDVFYTKLNNPYTSFLPIAIARDTSACANNPMVLSMTGSPIGSNGIYQWQISADTINWNNIVGAVNSTDTIYVSFPSYYRCIVTYNGVTKTSTPVFVNAKSPNLSYCTANLGGSACGTAAASTHIYYVNFAYLYNSNATCNSSNGSILTTYPAPGITTTSLQRGFTYKARVVTHNNTKISFWIDLNQNGIFEPSEWKQVCTTSVSGVVNSVSFDIPWNTPLGQTRIRIRSTYSTDVNTSTSACDHFTSGETEDYIVTIVPETVGYALANLGDMCAGYAVQLSLSESPTASGTNYQWQSSPDSLNWTNIVGATTADYSVIVNASLNYRCVISGGISNLITTSVFVKLRQANWCYCQNNLGGTPCNPPFSPDPSTHIFQVQIIGNLLNKSYPHCDNTNGSILSFYEPMDSTTAFLIEGHTYQLSVSSVGSAAISAWIDYNRNGVYESSEWIYVCTTSVNYVVNTVSFTVPQGISVGQTGMRVRSVAVGSQNGAADACSYFNSGQTEEYIVTLDTLLTGIKTISLNNNLSVVPNPATKNISVSFVNATRGSLYLKLMNINGECVYTEKLNQSVVGKLEKTIDVTRFAKGIYNLQMITNSGVANKKVVIE